MAYLLGQKKIGGNTPFLYILKTSVELAFNNSFANSELWNQASLVTSPAKRPIPKTLTALKNLMQILGLFQTSNFACIEFNCFNYVHAKCDV